MKPEHVIIAAALAVTGCAISPVTGLPTGLTTGETQAMQEASKARLMKMVEDSAPIAARAADCGYWDGQQWLKAVATAQMRHEEVMTFAGAQLSEPDITAEFADRFNRSLTVKDDPVWELGCPVAYDFALDWLVLWDPEAR
jgi:hypothetical protein